MNQQLIDTLTVVVLFGFVIALVLLIALLYRANRLLYKLDHLSDTFRSFVSDIVPAIVNIGTISTALHSLLRKFSEIEVHHSNKGRKTKDE